MVATIEGKRELRKVTNVVGERKDRQSWKVKINLTKEASREVAMKKGNFFKKR